MQPESERLIEMIRSSIIGDDQGFVGFKDGRRRLADDGSRQRGSTDDRHGHTAQSKPSEGHDKATISKIGTTRSAYSSGILRNSSETNQQMIRPTGSDQKQCMVGSANALGTAGIGTPSRD